MNRAFLPFDAIRNAAPCAPPRLFVLVPVYRHDPSPLLRALEGAATRFQSQVEILIYDDGSRDAALTQTLANGIARLASPSVLMTADENRGRAHARNTLIASSRARHVLFLDADMIPDAPNFLDRWLALIGACDPAVAFGGNTIKQAPRRRDTALHRYVAQRAECRTAAERAKDAAQFTTTSNLLVRRDVLSEVQFDPSFKGWGWEDVEWALRVVRAFEIMHVDIPATHAGLDTSDTLLRKYMQAGANYRRLAQAHPGAVERFASHRAARVMRRIPGQARVRAVLAALARASFAPLPMRHVALKLFRTSVYAENLP